MTGRGVLFCHISQGTGLYLFYYTKADNFIKVLRVEQLVKLIVFPVTCFLGIEVGYLMFNLMYLSN